MPQLRAPDGSIVSVPDEQASQLLAGGYQPVNIAEASAVTAAPERETSGALAPIGAAASSFLSGATLGLSDLAFKGLLDKGAYERLAADREAHPVVSGAGQLAGTLVGGPTPAGALNEATAAASAGRGFAARIAADAAAGSVYSAGAYLSDSALGDRELTAEGLRAALGAGFEFGAAGGVAALGIEKGTIAARRMFSRLADGTDRVANEAEQAWRAKHQATLEANDAAAEVARAKLAEAQLARQQAQLAQQRAAAGVADARAGIGGEPVGGPVAEVGTPGAVPAPGPVDAATAGGAPAPGVAPQLPPAVEQAQLLRDRAMQISEPEVQAWDAAHGARLRELQVAGGIPPELAALTSRPPMTGAARAAALDEAAERELAAALREHDAARADLDDVLAKIGAPDIQTPGAQPTLGGPAVPLGEFGAPGARGIKTPDELQRIAEGSAGDGLAPALAPEQPATAVLRGGAKGTPVGAAPEVAQPATAVGKRPVPAVEPAGAPTTGRIEVHDTGGQRMRATMPDGSTVDLGTSGADKFLAEQMPPGFRPAKIQTHQPFVVEHGLPATAADVAKLDENAIYIAKPSELAKRDLWGNELKEANRDSILEAWKKGEKLPPVDGYVMPDGRLYIEDGNHRIQAAARDGDRPVAIRFKNGEGYRPQSGAHEIGERIRGDLPGRTAERGLPEQAVADVESDLPSGFTLKKTNHGEVRADPEGVTVEEGIPPPDEVGSDGWQDHAHVLRPSELLSTGRELRGIESGADMLADSRTQDVLKAWKKGERVPALEIHVTKRGDYFVADGNHRLIAAAMDGDRPILAHFRLISGNVKTADKIGGLVERALSRRAEPGSEDLLTALSGTKSAIDKGVELADIGGAEAAAARAEQLIRHPATAERFMAKAGASDAAAKASGADLDAFFRDLTAPKTRDAYVAANIGRAMREEGSHAAALAKVEREWAERAATEAWTERAAILEYEGGYSRAEAERIAHEEMKSAPRGSGSESARPNPKRTEAAKKAAAASVERLHEIHSAVASNLPQELQSAWASDGYKFLREEAPRIRGVKDRINAASKISEAFTEKYGSASETFRGYEGDRFYRRAEIEAKHAESWANEQERKYYAAAMRVEHPLDVKRIEMAHDAALERAATAADPAERAAAAQEAKVIERQITAVGARPGAVEDVAAAAEVVTRYERASAKLAEALGDEAPPAAKEAAQAFRAAEDAADRKTLDRATRAIDDHVTSKPPAMSAADWNEQRMKQGLGDALAPPPRGEVANPRIAAAKAAKLRADAGVAHARAAETEARIGATTAKRTADEYRAAAEAARPAAATSGEPSKLGSVLTAVAAAGEIGIPGIPHPKDIPVIGPLLSIWTKYRIAKAMVGRFAGRVAATGDARAAALAARAKDKVAAAVDRTLGLAAEVAPKARAPLVATAAVLGPRLLDDGEPDARKGASAQELAAVRIREISAAASRPDLVVALVRKQLGGVADPDLIAAAEQVLQRQFAYLAGVMPKMPPANPYAKTQFVPSPAAAADLADRIGVLHDPASAFDNPTPAKADALANFYGKLFAVAQQRLAERAAELKEPLTNRQQLVASLIFRVPVASSMEPGHLALLQSAHVTLRSAMAPAPAQGAPPAPSVAQPTNLNQLYQPAGDRRAARM